MMRTSPRASTDLKTLAASDGRAERRARADHRVHLVDEQDQVRPLLDLADDVLDAVLEHAAQHRAGDHRVHLQVDDLAVAQPDRHGVRLELDAPRQPFDDRGLADAGLAEQHHRVGALAVAEDLEDLLHLVVAAEDRRQSCPAARADSGWSRSASGTAAARSASCSRSSRSSLSRMRVAMRETSTSGSMPWRRMIETGTPCLSSKIAEKRSVDSIGLAAGAARVLQRQLEHQLGRRRDAQLAAGHARQQPAGALRAPAGSRAGSARRSRMTWANMSHSTCANARKTCSLVSSACSRRRASSSARSTTRSADSAILLCGMSKSSSRPPPRRPALRRRPATHCR